MAQNQNPEDDLSPTLPKHTRSLPRIMVWFILLIADLILGGAVMLWLNLEPTSLLDPLEKVRSIVIALGVAGGLFSLETFLWKAVERLF